MPRIVLSVAAVAMWLCSSVVSAQQLDELRFGATWAQPGWLEPSHREGDQVGIGAELLFAPVNIDVFGVSGSHSSKFMNTVFNPRPHIGAMINLDENGTSYAFTGLSWHYDSDQTFFVEGSFGVSVNNGKTENSDPDRVKLGSNALFHESVGFGVNVSETITVVFAVEHLSHAGLFGSDNRGLTNASLRVGHKF